MSATEENRKSGQTAHPKEFYAWLLQELSDWQEEGLIQDNQAEVLRRRYALAEAGNAAAPTHTRLIRILTILGVLLIGAGIIIFFGANWQKMPNEVKLGIIFVFLIASYFLGYYWRYQRANYPTFGAALILLGTIIFGAGILLISQMYHLGGKLPTALLVWGAGALLMSWGTRLKPILILTLLVFTTGAVIEVTEYEEVQYLYLLFIGLTFLLSYLYQARLVVVLGLLGLTLWCCTASANWSPARHIYYAGAYTVPFVTSLLFGMLVYTAGYFNHFSLRTIGLAFWYRFFGLIMMLIPFYALSFNEVMHDFFAFFSRYPVRSEMTLLLVFILLLVFTLLVSILNLFFRQGRTRCFRYEMVGIILIGCFTFLVIGYPILMALGAPGQPGSLPVLPFTIVLNIIFFLIIIGIILMGYFNAEPVFVYLGLMGFVINLITRYCEYGWGMMDRALFFIGGGIILLIGGFGLERIRRRLLVRMKGNILKD